MLPKDSAALQKLRELFGFYNYQLSSEFKRVVTDRSYLENVHITEFSDLMAKHITQIHIIWATLKAK
jgi:hypothetical protein